MLDFMKQQWKNYKKPTPVLYRQIGDFLLLLTTAVGANELITGSTKISLIIILIGVIGKYLTNFKTEEKNDNN